MISVQEEQDILVTKTVRRILRKRPLNKTPLCMFTKHSFQITEGGSLGKFVKGRVIDTDLIVGLDDMVVMKTDIRGTYLFQVVSISRNENIDGTFIVVIERIAKYDGLEGIKNAWRKKSSKVCDKG